ncbi:hypothetical protein [Peribacillus tepidiphilus]|uniref:hypothetical protein n=1 Tax=Peribacillus tepidiphilus TaxID=2652445 RepID=UPI0035B565F8
MKKILFFCLALIVIINSAPNVGFAYSYGDPGKEALAEAYKELDKYIDANDWASAKKVYETYQKEFNLYFNKVKPDIEKGFKEKDKKLVLRSYQAAMRLNVERRLHFAQEQFDDYGQAKLLLAKARGTFTVLEPIMVEKEGQEAANKIYKAFDDALAALGNPGLFGIGSKNSDKESFDQNVTYIIGELAPLFPIVSEEEKDKSHLTEENLNILDKFSENGGSSFWFWFAMVLIVAFIMIVVTGKIKKKNER